jgi:transcriptional regulator with XRE-family HTH domain
MSPKTFRARRIDLNHTQESLAEFLCVTARTIARWESGTPIPAAVAMVVMSSLLMPR